jgi:hypothetical protein
MHDCTWGLLKVRERELQREHGGVQVESTSQEREKIFLFSGAFKSDAILWEGKNLGF